MLQIISPNIRSSIYTKQLMAYASTSTTTRGLRAVGAKDKHEVGSRQVG